MFESSIAVLEDAKGRLEASRIVPERSTVVPEVTLGPSIIVFEEAKAGLGHAKISPEASSVALGHPHPLRANAGLDDAPRCGCQRFLKGYSSCPAKVRG